VIAAYSIRMIHGRNGATIDGDGITRTRTHAGRDQGVGSAGSFGKGQKWHYPLPAPPERTCMGPSSLYLALFFRSINGANATEEMEMEGRRRRSS